MARRTRLSILTIELDLPQAVDNILQARVLDCIRTYYCTQRRVMGRRVDYGTQLRDKTNALKKKNTSGRMCDSLSQNLLQMPETPQSITAACRCNRCSSLQDLPAPTRRSRTLAGPLRSTWFSAACVLSSVELDRGMRELACTVRQWDDSLP